MLQNYFKIAWRSLLRHKLYSAINIFGLALGMACSLVIGLWVTDETSYNRFLPNLDNLYAVRVNNLYQGIIYTSINTNGLLAEVLKKDVPGVEYATKVQYPQDLLVKVGDKSIKQRGFYATSDFFHVFELPVVYGNPKAAIQDLHQIVITRRMASKFFGTAPALGKQLEFNDDKVYSVGAVVEDLPVNSTLDFDWIVNYKVQEQDWMQRWGNTFCTTYLRLQANTTPSRAEAAMKSIYARYTDWEDAKNIYPVLQPMKDVHLYGKYENGRPVGGQIEYVRIFTMVALFILLIACVNFMNLATARSAMRTKEIGIRKVVGAVRSSLVGQFLSESVLTSLFSALLALWLAGLVLPVFNAVFHKQLSLPLANSMLWLALLGLVLLTGLVSGSYPALFLSALKPIRILKGNVRFGKGPALLRQCLVVFQFTLSIFLIAGMLVVSRQMAYIRTKNLGLDRENVLYLPLEGGLYKQMEAFRQEVVKSSAIASATVTMSLPMDIGGSSGDLVWPGKDPHAPAEVQAMTVGYDFIKTMGITLLAGREFSSTRPADSVAYLINESAAALMGMKNPVGQQVKFWQGKGPVIGLMKDFHLQSLREPIKPLILCLNPANTSFMLIRTVAGKTGLAIRDLSRLTRQFNPNYPFEYHFADEAYETLYRSEQQVNTLINYFGVLAIAISCLGLFGLAAFTAQQRTKEIGVRKVLGATVGHIVSLLTKDFLRLVAVALVLATPLAWWALASWLETFEYRTQLSWWVFALAGFMAMVMALLTVGYQTTKAALANPVKSLRAQ